MGQGIIRQLPWVLCILVRKICLCMQYNIKINFLHFGPPRYYHSVVSLRAYVAYKMHIFCFCLKCFEMRFLCHFDESEPGSRWNSTSKWQRRGGNPWRKLAVALNVHLSDCLWCGATCRRVCTSAYRSTGASICWSYLEHTLIRYALCALSRCFTLRQTYGKSRLGIDVDLTDGFGLLIDQAAAARTWLWGLIWFNYNFVNV